MNQDNMHIHFDAEGDFLEIRFGPVKRSYDEYLGDDTFERRDRETDTVLGYAFYNVKKRQKQSPHDISVPMPRQ